MVTCIRTLLLLALLSMLSHVSWAENLLQLRVHEDKIFQDESFLLVVTAQGRFAIDDLDTRPLIEENFIIGNIDSNYSIDKNETYWRIPLLSHTAGALQIPSMLVGNNVTAPLPIVIRNKGRFSNYPELNNLIRYEISGNANLYTNQTIIYSVIITKPANVEIANITAPFIKNGNIHLIHEEKQQPSKANHNMAISKKTYAVSFNEAGEFEIIQPIITGLYNTALHNIPHALNNPVISNTGTIVLTDPSKQRSYGEPKARTKLRFVQQNPNIKLTIEGFKDLQNLIVADNFKITEAWSPNTKQVVANTPITHELEFEAVGASIDNFPKITMKETPQFKVYEDKGYSSESYDPKTGVLKAKQIVRYIYIPLKKMNLHFDPIEINWMSINDLKTDLKIFNLKKIDYEILPMEKEQYDLANNYQNKLLYIALGVLGFLLLLCIIYLLYLENIIKFNNLTNKLYNCKIKRNLIKKFDIKDPRTNYRLIINYAKSCIDPEINCFEKLPQYTSFKEELDLISYYMWKRSKHNEVPYDGSEFRKKLKAFIKLGDQLKANINKHNQGYLRINN